MVGSAAWPLIRTLLRLSLVAQSRPLLLLCIRPPTAMSDGKNDSDETMPAAASAAATAAPALSSDDQMPRMHSQKEDEPLTIEQQQRRALSPTAMRAQKQRGSDPAAAAAAEQEALSTLWRIVFQNSLQWDAQLRRLNTALALFGLVNFSLVVALYQLCWSTRTLHVSMGSECAEEPVLQLLSQLSYACFVVLLVLYYSAKSGYIATISHFPSSWSAFWYSGLRNSFFAELAASMIQPFPVLYLVLEMKDSQWLLLLALMAKLYLLMRFLRDHSEIYQKRHFIKVQQSQFDRSFFAMDYLTICKTYTYHHSSWVFFIGIMSNALCLAYLMHLAEREYWLPRDAHAGVVARKWEEMDSPMLLAPSLSHAGGGGGGGEAIALDESYGGTIDLLLQDSFGNVYFQSPFVSFLNCIYFVFIVATTTGLGDVSPSTPQGKIFAVLTALAGVAWTAFCVGVCTNKLVPSNFEAYCIDYLKRSEIERHKQHWAAILIQRTWRLHRAWKAATERGERVSTAARKAQFIETLTPAIRRFQRIQREDANVQFIFQDPSASSGGSNALPKGQTGTGSPVSSPASQLGLRSGPAIPSNSSAEPKRVGELSNAAVARSTEQQQQPAGRFSPSAASPLMRGMRSPQHQYGTLRREESRYLNRKRSGSSDRDDSDAPAIGSASGTPQISARNAATMLHHLKRQSSTVGTGGAGSSPPLLGGAGPLLGTPARPSRSLATGVGGSSYSAQTNALASLAAQNDLLFASLRSMELKIDQLLSASTRVSENMVERGHLFVSWTSNGRTGLAEDAVPTQMFLWHERDETKYGSLHWTTEEFAVQNRLRIKTPGNSFPLHSITDVHLSA